MFKNENVNSIKHLIVNSNTNNMYHIHRNFCKLMVDIFVIFLCTIVYVSFWFLVAGIPLWVSVVLVGVIGTVYTSLVKYKLWLRSGFSQLYHW